MNINFSIDTTSTDDLLAAKRVVSALLSEPVESTGAAPKGDVALFDLPTAAELADGVQKMADEGRIATTPPKRARAAAKPKAEPEDETPMALADDDFAGRLTEDEPPAEGISLSALQEIAKGVVVASPAGRDRLKAVLNDHDATRLSDLAVEHYASVAAALA